MNYLYKHIFSNILNWSLSPKDRNQRLIITALVFGLCYVVIVCQLIKISFDDNINSQLNQNIASKYRKDIVDRNGQILATNIPLASLFANPTKIKNPEDTIKKIKTVIPDIDDKKLLVEFTKGKTFVWIKRELTPQIQAKINELGLVGVYFENDTKRVYPQGVSMAHILGYVDRDNNGIAGIEKSFNDVLTSTNDKPVQLSLDYRIQNIVNEELGKIIDKFSALGGAGIVVDATNGEILAMVSKPDFDPHNPSAATADQLFNRASLAAYELGSGIKSLIFSMAFDTNVIQISDVYNLGNLTVGNFRVKDMHKHEGWNTVPQIFMNSSNIGTAMIALEMGKRTVFDYFERLGLSKQLDIEIPERAHPIFPKEKKVNDLALVTMSYGYTFSISPMHFVQAMVPVVNGGYKYPVTLIKREGEATIPEKIFKDETSISMLKLMRLTVEKGTGRKAGVKGYLVAGKTGTAEKLGPDGAYQKNHRYSSFVAVAPSINPKYLVFVFLDDPRGIKETFGLATAGFTAAPVAGGIISRMGSLLGIQPFNEEDEEIKKMLHVDYEVNTET